MIYNKSVTVLIEMTQWIIRPPPPPPLVSSVYVTGSNPDRSDLDRGGAWANTVLETVLRPGMFSVDVATMYQKRSKSILMYGKTSYYV